MLVWSSHRADGCWEHGWICTPPSSLCSFLLYKHNSSLVMDETGWSLSYLWEQKVLSPSVRTRRSECHYMVGGEKKKDIWHWNEVHACNSCGDGKWLQFIMSPFLKWKRSRPPELSWANLLFQSCSNHVPQCPRVADRGNIEGYWPAVFAAVALSAYLVDRKGQ